MPLKLTAMDPSPMFLLNAAALTPVPLDCMSLASSPTRMSPSSRKQMTEGVISFPKALGMITGLFAFLSYLATAEYVVPRSIPTFISHRNP